MRAAELVELNGVGVWANYAPAGGGLRLRLSLDDWERLGLFRGQRIVVRVSGKAEAALYLAEVTEIPPFVWAVMVERVRSAG